MHGVDTRELTKHIRSNDNTVLAQIKDGIISNPEKCIDFYDPNEINLVDEVSSKVSVFNQFVININSTLY